MSDPPPSDPGRIRWGPPPSDPAPGAPPQGAPPPAPPPSLPPTGAPPGFPTGSAPAPSGGHGLGVLLVIGGEASILGFLVLLSDASSQKAGIGALIAGAALLVLAIVLRDLRPAQLRTTLGVSGAILVAFGTGLAVLDGVDNPRVRAVICVVLFGAIALGLATSIPSAVAAGLVPAAGGIATGLIASLAGGNPVQAAAAAATIALAAILVGPQAAARLPHPAALRWIVGAAALVAAAALDVTASTGAGFAAAAAGVTGAALCLLAQRLRNLPLAIGAFAGLSAALGGLVRANVGSTTSAGGTLLGAGLVILVAIPICAAVARHSQGVGRPIVVPPLVAPGLLAVGTVLTGISIATLDTERISNFGPLTPWSPSTFQPETLPPFPTDTFPTDTFPPATLPPFPTDTFPAATLPPPPTALPTP